MKTGDSVPCDGPPSGPAGRLVNEGSTNNDGAQGGGGRTNDRAAAGDRDNIMLPRRMDSYAVDTVDGYNAAATTLSDQEVDRRIAASFAELTVEERHEALEDVHGVADRTRDPPDEALEHILTELEQALDKLSRSGRMGKPDISATAYKLVKATYPEYVTSHEFRMRILRTERFDVGKTAERIFHHFSWKLKLFGEGRLGKEIQLTDLPAPSREIYREGRVRLLPHRDQAGRLVLFCTKEAFAENIAAMDLHRLLWYLMNVASHDNVTQRKGLVSIGWMIGWQSTQNKVHERSQIGTVTEMKQSVPVRDAASHWCTDNDRLAELVRFGALLVGRAPRVRIRVHVGSTPEVLYQLVSFGIPRVILPINGDGVVEIEAHRASIDGIIASETNAVISAVAGSEQNVPTDKDVLLGQGKALEESPGNLRLRELIESNSSRYEKASRFDKTTIAHNLVQAIKASGGRFLKQAAGDGWEVVVDTAARDKISHAFRNFRARGQTWGRRGRKSRPPKPDAQTSLNDGDDSSEGPDALKRPRYFV